jgi:tRNA-dihydrouridine synthase B
MNNFWTTPLRIDNLVIPRFMAAPLDGVTDSPLRQVIREFSKDELLMTEMRHVAHVAHEKEPRSLKYKQLEHPLAFQVSANRVQDIDTAVEKVITSGFKMLNLNSGCPSPTVTKSGSGSALMADLPRLRELLLHFNRTINGRIPFTLKIRAGYKFKNAVEVAKMAQDCGVSCLMIHPRTAPEGFTSRLDFDIVRQIKQELTIPIVFSGNVNNFERAKKTYELTGVDGFMIGRALWGAPWKLKEMSEAAHGRQFSLTTGEMVNFALQNFHLNIEHYGERIGFNGFKKQVAQYIRNVEGAAEWRKKLLTAQTAQLMQEYLEELAALYAATPTPIILNHEDVQAL